MLRRRAHLQHPLRPSSRLRRRAVVTSAAVVALAVGALACFQVAAGVGGSAAAASTANRPDTPAAAPVRTAAAAATTPPATIPARGGRWFALGASVPYLQWRCDFGCGAGGGVRGRDAQVDRMLTRMSRRGVRVVRWYLFPGDAWQVRRTGDGTPTSIAPAALADLDRAVALAAKRDVYLLPAVLPSPEALPRTWFTDPTQQAALGAALRPLFARYAAAPNVLGWELATSAELLVDRGLITSAQLRSLVETLRAAQDSTGHRAQAIVAPDDVAHIAAYSGLGLDAYAPLYTHDMTGARCAACTSVAALASTQGADAPVLVGGYDAASDAAASSTLASLARRGYAGALAWSWTGLPQPSHPSAHRTMPDVATWRWHYAHGRSGPRARPLNPCIGPDVAAWACPNLQMSPPSTLFLGRRGGRSVLFSANSVNSVGVGPASIRGTRDGRYTMRAVQLLHRRRGGMPARIATGAKLRFKAIPGQGGYWKWNGAARMELWRLDASGTPVEIVRHGPKTVYCLRDLKRTRGFLAGSPRGAVFPGCNRSSTTRAVTLGTSVGWSDVYPATYYENWIDVSGLRGCFAYVHVADPTDAIYELNEDDNTSRVVVRLPFTGSNRGCPGAEPLPTTGIDGAY